MTKTNYNTIDEYIATFPEDIQKVLEKFRNVIREAAPEAEEVISYQMPTFKLGKNLVHFAGYKNHIGFYPAPSGIKAFQHRFENYKWSKGAVQFPLDKPIPYDLITEIVQFRVRENSLKKTKK